MFSSISWGEMLILLVAALVILGPERLPGAIKWTGQTLRQVRDYATGATAQLKQDLGPEFDEIRKPLEQLNELRSMNPKSMVTKHLFDGDDSFLTGNFDKPVSSPSSNYGQISMSKDPKPLERNERPPLDPDAT
ncbi:Sec-independent protein translocase subunit TatB [Nocardia sp. 2]|uniref:Sec-independent protein translocase protein TatB n=1 Tax=Nocardia acididurans TaxID=2802282 RepID=A0ABS1M641_9NOCA|nr:Sec-independent protein translocase protein TatB [Nocardia acididurans]MBL1076107.1 Sec-independent protein translocase subunit TatB [Nocardia acididurans]